MESQAFYWFWDNKKKLKAKGGVDDFQQGNRGRWQEPKWGRRSESSLVPLFSFSKAGGGGPGEGLGF
jgi:hypothetical protein